MSSMEMLWCFSNGRILWRKKSLMRQQYSRNDIGKKRCLLNGQGSWSRDVYTFQMLWKHNKTHNGEQRSNATNLKWTKEGSSTEVLLFFFCYDYFVGEIYLSIKNKSGEFWNVEILNWKLFIQLNSLKLNKSHFYVCTQYHRPHRNERNSVAVIVGVFYHSHKHWKKL